MHIPLPTAMCVVCVMCVGVGGAGGAGGVAEIVLLAETAGVAATSAPAPTLASAPNFCTNAAYSALQVMCAGDKCITESSWFARVPWRVPVPAPAVHASARKPLKTSQ